MNPRSRFGQARDFLTRNRADHSSACREFQWPRPREFNWALDWFDPYAQGNRRLALWVLDEDAGECKLSYDQLRQRSNQAANCLRGLGVERGDRILLMLPAQAPLWELMLAATKLGAVIVPATTLLSQDDLEDRLNRGRIRHLIAADSQAEEFDEMTRHLNRVVVGKAVPGWHSYELVDSASDRFSAGQATMASDPLLLYFTSGTTARPKLVLHTHQSYPVGHLSTLYWLGLQEGDLHLNVSSPGWAKHAWSSFFAPFSAGAAVFAPHRSRFDPDWMLSKMSSCGVTTICAPPTVWRLMIQTDLKRLPLNLREVCSAGEPLNPNVIERIHEAWGRRPRDGYGQTETTAQIGNSPGMAIKPGSMGLPLPGYRIELLDGNGLPAEEGQIAIRTEDSPVGLASGYLAQGELRPAADSDGYYRTGDVARRDGDGYFTFIGRADDLFKSSDYRISPFELESCLNRHEAVSEAAVVPSPHPTKLFVPKAFLALKEGCRPSRELALELFRFSRQHLSPFKRIRRLEFAELPKTVSGKIRRVELRDRESEAIRSGRSGQADFEEAEFPELAAKL